MLIRSPDKRVFHALEIKGGFFRPSLGRGRTLQRIPCSSTSGPTPPGGCTRGAVSSRQSQRESLPVKFMNAQGLMIDSTLEEVEQIEGMEAYGFKVPTQKETTTREIGVSTSEHRLQKKLQTGFSPHLTDRYEAWECGVRTDPLPRIFSLPPHSTTATACQLHSLTSRNTVVTTFVLGWPICPTPSKRPSQTPLRFENSVRPWAKKHNERSRYGMQTNPRRTMNTTIFCQDLISKFGQCFVASQHAEFEVPPDAELSVMLSTMFRPKPRFPVRLFMVNDIKPEHNVPKLVSFSKVSFHKSVERKSRKARHSS